MEIGAYFQCYKQPCATLRALTSFRDAYPNGTIVLVSDDGLKYYHMSRVFNCIYIHDSQNLDVNWKSTDRQKIHAFFERFSQCASLIKEEYFMLLEDDVAVLRKITEPLLGDLNGNGYNTLSLDLLKLYPELSHLHNDVVYTGHGGSIWNTRRFVEFASNKKLIDHMLDKFHLVYGAASEDQLSTLLCLLSGGKLHYLKTHKDLLTDRVTNLDEVAILHQCKQNYSKQTFPEDVMY